MVEKKGAKKATAKKKTTAAKPAMTKKTIAKKRVTPKPAATTKKTVAKKTVTPKPVATTKKTIAKKTVTPKPVATPVTTTLLSPSGSIGSGKWKIALDSEKFFIAAEQSDFLPALPSDDDERASSSPSTGDTRIVALARDPFTLFVYWDVQGEAVESARASLNAEWTSLTWRLRLYSVAPFPAQRQTLQADIPVTPEAGSHYLTVPAADSDYRVAIGLCDANATFVPVATSNLTRTPRAGVAAPSRDPEWAASEETLDAIHQLSGGGAPGAGSLDSSLFGGASEEISSFGLANAGRDFFLELDCSLTVWGRTTPDATVTLQGAPVTLGDDGTFIARFPLPDGVIDIPVIALSGDRLEEREISPTINRRTRTDRRMRD